MALSQEDLEQINDVFTAREKRAAARQEEALKARDEALLKGVEGLLAKRDQESAAKAEADKKAADEKAKKEAEEAAARGEGGDDKPKGPYANLEAKLKGEFEKQLKAEREAREKLEKERAEEKKEREAEKVRLRQQAIDSRKDSIRSKIESTLASDKFVRDPEKAEALRLKMEKDGLLSFDEQGNAKLTVKRVRYQGEAAEPKDFDLSASEGLEAALADWTQTDNAKKWLPAAPPDKKTPANNPPPARRQATPPQQRGLAEQQRGGDDLSEDDLLARAEERMGGADVVRSVLTSQ